jgi:tape measure domain-containing protein
MAMTLDTAIKFTAKLEGTGLDQLKRNLQGLSQQSNVSKRSLDQLYTATKALGSASNNTVAGLQRTVGALKALRDNAEFGSRKFKLLTNDIEAAERRLQRFQSTASSSGGLSRGGALLAGAAGGVAGALAVQGADLARRGVQGIGQVGLDAESSRVRLRALANEFGEYNAALAATDRIAKTLRLSNTEAEQSFASLYASLRPTGITLAELEKAFIGFSAAARNSGATAQETSNALIQLKQGLASGVLQGEELRSIREQAPLVAQAIAKELGVTIGELKDLAAEGKVTTDVVLRALGKLNDTQLGKLNEQFQTGQQAIKDFQVATQELGIELARIFGPTAISLLRNFTGALKEASDVLGGITGNGEAGRRAQLRVQANQQAARETNDKFGVFSFFQQGSKNQFLLKREQEIFQELLQQQTRPADQVSASQREAQERAARERASAAERSAMEKAKKNLADQLKIREDMEKRLADFREQSIRRAADLERDLGDQRLQLERDTAETRRRIAAQEQDAAFERERQRLRGAGLGTDALDTQARLNEATRRFTEQKIQIEQNATDRKVQLERTIEDYKITVARGISEILQDAADKMAQKMVAGAREAAGELGGGTASPGSVGRGQLGVGNLVALARSAGFRGQDAAVMAAIAMAESGGRSSAYNGNAATGDKSYGLWQINMLGGMGPQRRRAFGIGNNEALFDPATNANAARQVFGSQGFGAWSVYRSGAYKDYLPAAMAASRNGSARMLVSAPAGNTAAPGLPGVAAAGRSLNAAIGANRGAGTTAALGDLIASRQSELGNITSELDSQRKSTSDQLRDYQQILDLQRSGMSPEIAKQRVDAENAAVAEAVKLNTLRDQLVQDREIAGLTDKQKATIDEMITSIDARNAAQMQTINGLTAEQQQLERLKLAYEEKKQLVQGIANSIGNGIGSAIDLLIDGTDNWGDSLRSIAAGVLKDIARQIAQTMVIAPIVKGITSAFGFANGGIMTSDGPLPLRKYAGGGIANSPQLAMFGEGSMPEAYVPLPDGRRIPVAMKGGGGGTNVVVNVDATGSQVQGDAGRGEQLGRAISQAVQAELVKQKRPGGLLAA